MEVTLLRANMLESNEATMARFLHGLNKDIQDVVELYHYTSMDDLRLSKRGAWPRRRPTLVVLATRGVRKRRKTSREKTRV
ncbi:hypothetical protein CR513_56782, partial [Mucuna pruriens]